MGNDAVDSLRRISLCIDDYGYHSGVNDAAVNLVAKNIVHTVSCMSSMPSWFDSASALKEFDEHRVDVGLHLNLTEAPSRQRYAESLPRLIAKAYSRQLPKRVVEDEVLRQFDEFEVQMGRLPAFIDGHQHVHQLPGVREILAAVIRKRFSNKKPWLRSTRICSTMNQELSRWHKQRVIYSLGGRRFDQMARTLGCKQNNGLLGVYNFQGNATQYLDRLAIWLDHSEQGALLMCHPAIGTGSSESQRDAIWKARLTEYQALTSGAFRELVTGSNIELRPLVGIGVRHSREDDREQPVRWRISNCTTLKLESVRL